MVFAVDCRPDSEQILRVLGVAADPLRHLVRDEHSRINLCIAHGNRVVLVDYVKRNVAVIRVNHRLY